jgi:predicted PolB exonuclease-like 3'-5' exonuclease
MKPSIIVWDLETVPDLAGFAAVNDLVGRSDVEVREAIGDKFPKHIYHSIICIVAHWEADHWAVDAVGAPSKHDTSCCSARRRRLLNDAWDIFCREGKANRQYL